MGTDGDLMVVTEGCDEDRWVSNGGDRQGDLIIGTEMGI
jgi:hypothetical protein